MQVETIKITDEDFELPKEAVGLRDPYSALGESLIGFDNHPKLKKQFKGDISIARQLLVKGPVNGNNSFGCAASLYADSLDHPLELILDERKPNNMGLFLNRGGIIVRGSLGRETGDLRGGYLFVDGNVDHFTGTSISSGGIVYIRGDVHEVEDMYRGVLIVGGNIGRVTNKQNSHNGKFPSMPSPFVFTKEPVTLTGGYKREKRVTRQSYLVPEYELINWSPDNLVANTLNLVRRVLRTELEAKIAKAESILSVEEADTFFTRYVEGYSNGYNSGYYQGMLDALPHGD